MTTILPTAKQSAFRPAHQVPTRDPNTVPNTTGAPEPRRLLDRLTSADLRVLRLYLFTRVGLWLVAYCATWLSPAEPHSKTPVTWLSRWEQWDWVHYQHIAQYGYFDPFPGIDTASDNRVAFFPGFPFLLRVVHTLIPDWAVAGLLISLVSGAMAVVALARIAGLGRADSALAGQRATSFLLLSPAAVFLAAAYTESLFLAFALPAWIAAKHRNWPVAGVLAALATTTRISGLFLAAAITIECILARDEHQGRGRLGCLPWCAVPAVPAAAYISYLYANTGDWMAWKHAQERGWNRDFHTPVEAFRNTWRNAFDYLQTTGYAWEFQLELAAMAIGLLLLCLLLVRRRWPEALYVGLNLWALGTSYWYLSIPRATLLWWPLWTGLAHWSLRRAWVKEAYVGVVGPLMVVLAVTFTSGGWSG
ncbi:mannosyltransferase family protein [Streptomyces sp. NPDC002159]